LIPNSLADVDLGTPYLETRNLDQVEEVSRTLLVMIAGEDSSEVDLGKLT